MQNKIKNRFLFIIQEFYTKIIGGYTKFDLTLLSITSFIKSHRTVN